MRHLNCVTGERLTDADLEEMAEQLVDDEGRISQEQFIQVWSEPWDGWV